MKKNMNYYNKKCLGCGQYFSKEKNNPAYVEKPNEKTKFCKRCFQLKNYGVLNNEHVSNDEIIKTLNEIDFSLGKIILILDLFDIDNCLLPQFKDNQDMLLVINKIGFFKEAKKREMVENQITNYLRKMNWNQEIIFYDSIHKYKISSIDSWIKKQTKQNKKVYIAGNTNVGKSSLINALLQFNKKEPILTVSSIKNTTLNVSKIALDKFSYVIDTPGFLNECNFLSIINTKKKINFKKMINISYPLKDNKQVFFVQDLFKIKCTQLFDDSKSSIQFFLPDNVLIHRTNVKNEEKIENKKDEVFEIFLEEKYKKKTISFNNFKKDVKYCCEINGIGYLTIKNVHEVELQIPEHFEMSFKENYFI